MQHEDTSPSMDSPIKVMVRGFGEEPVVLWAVGQHGGRVEVVGEDRKHSLRYPADLVQDYDEDRFKAILQAYEGEDYGSLKRLWDDGDSWKNT